MTKRDDDYSWAEKYDWRGGLQRLHERIADLEDQLAEVKTERDWLRGELDQRERDDACQDHGNAPCDTCYPPDGGAL